MHRPSLARMAMSLLLGAVGSLGLSKHEQAQAPRTRGWRNPLRSILSSNGYTGITNGKRECARRRGGRDWLDARNACRARRGLAAINR